VGVFGNGPWKYVILAPMIVVMGAKELVLKVRRVFKRKDKPASAAPRETPHDEQRELLRHSAWRLPLSIVPSPYRTKR